MCIIEFESPNKDFTEYDQIIDHIATIKEMYNTFMKKNRHLDFYKLDNLIICTKYDLKPIAVILMIIITKNSMEVNMVKLYLP